MTRARHLLLVGLSAGLGGAVFAGLRLMDSRYAVIAIPGSLLVLGVGVLVNKLSPRAAPPPGPEMIVIPLPPRLPREGRISLPSLYAERIPVRDVARERRVCDVCRFTIRHELEGELCWIAVRVRGAKTVLVHLHLECADEIGEPLQ